MSTKSTQPEQIINLQQRCITHVNKRFGITLDYTSETLSLLDHYATAIVTEENNGKPSEPGSTVRLNMVNLFAPTLGAYFGETLRRIFGGRWRFTDREPQHWRFEFDSFFTRINPAGVAANVLAAAPLDTWGGDILSAPVYMPKLEERLSHAPDISSDDFYTFGTMFELLQISEDFLKAISPKNNPVDCSIESYNFILKDM